MPQPFTISIDDAVLADLRSRLAATRWPDEIDNEKWEYGTNEHYIRELCDYWQHQFNWKAQEAYLNSFQHYRTTIDDVDLHFICQKGAGKTSVPLLLIHGWPDSFVRFLKIIPLLTAADANGFSFDVVVPSLPGYGFSGITKEPGMNPKKIAGLLDELMTKELGYNKYIAQGGDWGSTITEQLALYHDESLWAIHLTDVPSQHSMMPVDTPSADEKKYLEEMKIWQQTEGGYFMEQSTKPQTLAYGLNDSPAGLAGWIVEKFKVWTDNDGAIEDAITRDELLTNLTIYWVTATINASIRIYYEAMKALMQSMHNPLQKINPFDKTGDKSKVPAAFAIFPKDLSRPPKEFAERFFNVQQWSKMSKGGHFAAMEEPQALADNIRMFASKLNLDR